jgi:hypothetical protein
LVLALRQLGFALTESQAADIERGKDFIQLKNGPFDLDLVFAPDGIERFDAAWQRHVEVEGFPVCHIDDIIASKAATAPEIENRVHGYDRSVNTGCGKSEFARAIFHIGGTRIAPAQ